jgi:hypothetical protein
VEKFVLVLFILFVGFCLTGLLAFYYGIASEDLFDLKTISELITTGRSRGAFLWHIILLIFGLFFISAFLALVEWKLISRGSSRRTPKSASDEVSKHVMELQRDGKSDSEVRKTLWETGYPMGEIDIVLKKQKSRPWNEVYFKRPGQNPPTPGTVVLNFIITFTVFAFLLVNVGLTEGADNVNLTTIILQTSIVSFFLGLIIKLILKYISSSHSDLTVSFTKDVVTFRKAKEEWSLPLSSLTEIYADSEIPKIWFKFGYFRKKLVIIDRDLCYEYIDALKEILDRLGVKNKLIRDRIYLC